MINNPIVNTSFYEKNKDIPLEKLILHSQSVTSKNIPFESFLLLFSLGSETGN
jgi:hypothetical protein